MPTLTWSDSLALNHGQMDETHQEFVALLAALEQALDQDCEAVSKCFAEVLAHTERHFAQEEQWMQRIGFAAENCHSMQHRHVLAVLREVQSIVGTTGDAQILRRLVAELANWFPAHAQMMDAALAETMVSVGFDAQTGTVTRPLASEQGPITGCGSSSCS